MYCTVNFESRLYSRTSLFRTFLSCCMCGEFFVCSCTLFVWFTQRWNRINFTLWFPMHKFKIHRKNVPDMKKQKLFRIYCMDSSTIPVLIGTWIDTINTKRQRTAIDQTLKKDNRDKLSFSTNNMIKSIFQKEVLLSLIPNIRNFATLWTLC